MSGIKLEMLLLSWEDSIQTIVRSAHWHSRIGEADRSL